MLRFNAEQCTECHACRLRCSFVKEEEYNPDKARLSITGKWPELPKLYSCRLCKDPECVAACPFDALSQNAKGVISVDYEACTECGLCVEACPYDAVLQFKGRILICDTCDGEYLCTKACSTDAIFPGEER